MKLATISILMLYSFLAGCTGVDPSAGRSTDEQAVSISASAAPIAEDEAVSTESENLGGCRCFGTWHTTPSAACSTGSCSESQSCLYDYLSGYVDCGGDDLCSQNLVITQSCFSPGPGSWQVNGYMRYKCGFWECY